MSSAAISSTMHSLTACRPSVGPYWSACAAGRPPISEPNSLGSNSDVSGRPPASDMTSGRSVIAIISRSTDERIRPVRVAKSAS
jgi:hypothetical protein